MEVITSVLSYFIFLSFLVLQLSNFDMLNFLILCCIFFNFVLIFQNQVNRNNIKYKCKEKAKTLNIRIYILYNSDRMSQIEKQKVRIGKKENAILEYLLKHPNGVWQQDILDEFSWASRYDSVILKRLYNMQEKGLIVIKTEINPETGRQKKRVYLKQ